MTLLEARQKASEARAALHKETHPTLEQHVEQIRRGWSYQSLFEQLRAQEETP